MAPEKSNNKVSEGLNEEQIKSIMDILNKNSKKDDKSVGLDDSQKKSIMDLLNKNKTKESGLTSDQKSSIMDLLNKNTKKDDKSSGLDNAQKKSIMDILNKNKKNSEPENQDKGLKEDETKEEIGKDKLSGKDDSVEEVKYEDQLVDKSKEDIKKKALEALKNQKVAIVNIEEIAEAEARKGADAYMTESKKDLKGVKGFLKKIWKHTFFDEFYRQREVSRIKEEIKTKDNIYTRRVKDNSEKANDDARKAISERFISEYDNSLILSKGEERKVLDNNNPEINKANSDIKDLIYAYALGKIDAQAFKNEKVRIIDSLKTDDLLKESDNYADNLFEIAENVKIALDHGAKIEELNLDTNIIVGKAKSSLKTEAHFNMVDKGVDWMKKTKVGRFLSPAVLSTAVGITYCIGTKFLASKGGSLLLGLGGAVAISSALAGMNESQRVALERGQHGIEMAEGGEFEPGSKRREQMDKFTYQMEKSSELSSNLKNLIFENGDKEAFRNFSKDDLDAIFSAIAEIDARNSLNSKNRIDLISYDSIGSVEKQRTEMTILVAKAKVELKRRLESDLNGSLPNETYESYLEKNTEAIEGALQGGEKGITAQDRAFKKYKIKRVAKKVLQTATFGFIIGGTIQEGFALGNDDVQGVYEGLTGSNEGAMSQTPFESAREWISGNVDFINSSPAETILGGNVFHLPQGTSIVDNLDGTFDIFRGDELISDNTPLTFDADGKLDADSLARLGESGIVASTSTNVVESVKEVTTGAKDYLANHPESSSRFNRIGWYDDDTPKPLFEKNELKLWWGGEGNTGINSDGNYSFDVSHMTSDGSYHQNFSVDAQDAMKKGLLKMVFSLTGDTQNQLFELPIGADGSINIDPNSEIGKLFFDVENGHAVFKGRFAEVIQSFGMKDGVEQIKSLSTLEGPGNDSIKDIIKTITKESIHHFDIPKGLQPPWFIPVMARSPLEKLKEKEGFVYDESYLDRDSIYEDPTYQDESMNVYYENENYLDRGKYLDQDVIEEKVEKLNKESIEKYLGEMKNYIDKNVDIKMMEELNTQIKESMDNSVRMSVVLPCYKEGENIYKTLSDWTVKQKDLKPEELEIITFVNAPDKDQELDKKTISEIERFKKDHPEYKIQLVKHNFDFKSNRKMGAIYKMPTDLAVYRNMKRLESGVPEEIVASHLLRSGGADALGRNPRFLREILDFMENHPNTEQLRTQSAYPPEVREKFPLFNLVTVFNHTLSQLYTRGESNIGLGTYRARAYAEASGFDPSREYREEIDLGMRIRAKQGRNKDAITKLVKKNAIDNPRRELFALASGDTVLRAYNNFSKPEKDQELRKFDWNKDLPESYKKNIEMNSKNMSREFDAYFQHYLTKIERESGTISQILDGKLNEKSIRSSNLHPETRALLNDPEGIDLIRDINEKRKAGVKFNRSSNEIKKLSEFATRRLFNRILLLTFGFKKGLDYDYETSSDGKLHLVFKQESVEKTKKMAENKWKNFKGYWNKDDLLKTNESEKKKSKEKIDNTEKYENSLIDQNENSQLKRYTKYELFTALDPDGNYRVEIINSNTGEEYNKKGLIPKEKNEELIKDIDRIKYNISNFGEAYGMPEVSAVDKIKEIENLIQLNEQIKTKEIISSDKIQNIIKEKLGSSAKIEKLELDFNDGKLQINSELDGGILGGKIKINGSLENSGNSIAVNEDLQIEARGYVKSRIENSLSKLVTEIKKHFEKVYKKEIKSMKIENGGLTLNFKE